MSVPTVLYHYTCDDGARMIGPTGRLRPNQHTLLPDLPPIVWLTDLASPDRDGLGLTSSTLTCDRTAHRYEVRVVNPAAFHHWPWLRDHGPFQLDPDVIATLERFGKPDHWWVTMLRVQARRTPSEVRP